MKRHYTEHIGVGENGHLWVEGCDTVDLAERFGTPLYVVSENQIRHNYRAFYQAWAAHYPGVQVLFANKANNNLAVRRVFQQEGAGGDCFGLGELYMSLLAGVDPKKLVVNGSNKTAEEMEMAVQAGVAINVDSLEELDTVNAIAGRLGRVEEIGVRMKPALATLKDRPTHYGGSIADFAVNHKWGLPLEDAVEAIRRALTMPNVKLTELHYHLGRVSREVSDFEVMARGVMRFVVDVRDRLGWEPEYLDLGGGYAWGRAEGHGHAREDDGNTPSYADYARTMATVIREECEAHGVGLPTLRLEPGRGLASNIAVLLGRVGTVKEWKGVRKWVNVDCSTNHVNRIVFDQFYYHIVAASKADAEPSETVDVVGPLCTLDVLGSDRQLPPLDRGDLVALLDTGAYTETLSLQFNAQPRPASVMVCGDQADVITERETVQDIVGRYRIPPRLL